MISPESVGCEVAISDACMHRCEIGPMTAMNAYTDAQILIRANAVKLAPIFPEGIEGNALVCMSYSCNGPEYDSDGDLACARKMRMNFDTLSSKNDETNAETQE